MFCVSRHGEVVRIRVARAVLGRPLYEVSCYLLGDTLVDTGCPATARRLAAWARARGVRRVVHTHHHEDHTGGDAVLHRELGVEILGPLGTVSFLERPYRLPLYRRLVWGQPRPAPARPFEGEVEIGGRRFLAIHTPGHAPDHHCLFDPVRGWLFSGDLYLGARTVYLRGAEEAGLVIRSLRRLVALKPRLMLCAHAGVVRDPVRALERKIAFWERLSGEAERLVAAGASPATAARRLLGREGLLRWVSLGDFSKAHLVASLLRARSGLSWEREESDATVHGG